MSLGRSDHAALPMSLSLTLCPAGAVSEKAAPLGVLLHAVVHAGASVGFVLPFSLEDSIAYWRHKVAPSAEDGMLALFLAQEGQEIVGTVQLYHDMPPNQPHRAEVRKLLVHPDYRRRGLARHLMTMLERHARTIGRSLVTLDTRTGDVAEPLYVALGYHKAGVIPAYCRNPVSAEFDSTTIMYKSL